MASELMKTNTLQLVKHMELVHSDINNTARVTLNKLLIIIWHPGTNNFESVRITLISTLDTSDSSNVTPHNTQFMMCMKPTTYLTFESLAQSDDFVHQCV